MRGWVAAVRRRGAEEDQLSDHALREQRLDGIRDSVEQFTYALALLIAGHDAPEDSVYHDLTTRLRRELRPFLEAGEAMRPDFGMFGDLRIEGELLKTLQPVVATLDFDDRCTRETALGRVVPPRGRRLRIIMHIAIDPVRILDCAISEVADRRG
jgi:hypothetical protein